MSISHAYETRLFDDTNGIGLEIIAIPRSSLGEEDTSDLLGHLAQEANQGNQQFRWLEGVVDADGDAIRSGVALLLLSEHAPETALEISQLRTVDGLIHRGNQVSLSPVGNALVDHFIREPILIQEQSEPRGRAALEILIGTNMGFLVAAGNPPLMFLTVPAGIFAVRAAAAAGGEIRPAAGKIFRAVGDRLAQWISQAGGRSAGRSRRLGSR